jgi:hypothetical protein
MEESQESVPANPFDGLNSKSVLDKVPTRLTSERSRSLWRRIDSEVHKSGVDGAETYLRALFSEVIQRAKEDLSTFKNERT